MLPISHKSVFRSRWMALLWSAGIIWFAVDVAGSPEDSNGNTVAAAQDNGVEQAIAALDKVK